MLGTERGIVVLDVRRNITPVGGTASTTNSASVQSATAVVLRGRVSDRIACVDLHSLDGERYKYLLMCGTATPPGGEQLCYLYALESDGRGALMQWAQLDPWLLGGRLFGLIRSGGSPVTENAATSPGNSFRVVAVDSKNVLQCRNSDDDFVTSTRIVCETPPPPPTPSELQPTTPAASRVTCLSCCGDYVVVGRTDGSVSDNRKSQLMRLTCGPITFLECFETITSASGRHQRSAIMVVAGTPNSYRISSIPVEIPSTQVRKCFVHANWLVIVKQAAAFQVFDLQSGDMLPCTGEQIPDGPSQLGGCDLVDDCLVIATTRELYCWRIGVEQQRQANASSHDDSVFADLRITRRPEMQTALATTQPRQPNSTADIVVCAKLSAAHEFVAIGLRTGAIDLYRLAAHRTLFVQTLRSHRQPVAALLFAPWSLAEATAIGRPLVLASVAAELCFWDCSHADNNRGGREAVEAERSLRRSGRFRDRPSPVTPEEDDAQLLRFTGMRLDAKLSSSPWTGKNGDPRKPTMLACVKFIGSRAEQLFANAAFDRFLTIDDSGEIYHFVLRGWNAANSETVLEVAVADVAQRLVANGETSSLYQFLSSSVSSLDDDDDDVGLDETEHENGIDERDIHSPDVDDERALTVGSFPYGNDGGREEASRWSDRWSDDETVLQLTPLKTDAAM